MIVCFVWVLAHKGSIQPQHQRRSLKQNEGVFYGFCLTNTHNVHFPDEMGDFCPFLTNRLTPRVQFVMFLTSICYELVQFVMSFFVEKVYLCSVKNTLYL